MDMVTTTATATMTTIASRWQQPPQNDVVEISDSEKTTSLGAGNVANVPIGSEEYRTFLKNRLDLACASVAFLRGNCKERQDSATMFPNKGSELSNDDEEETDAKRARKMLSNKESSRRCRRRKHDQLAELEAQVSQLKDENSYLLKRLIDVSQKHNDTAIDNRVLKANVETLKTKVKMAEETIKSLLVVKYQLS